MLNSTPSFPPISPKTIRVIRTARATMTILEGQEVLLEGSESARRFWNAARVWQRQYHHDHHDFAGWTTLQKGLRQERRTYDLNDRCFSYLLRRFNANLLLWANGHTLRPELKAPGYAHRPQPLLFETGRNIKVMGPWTYRLTVLSKAHPARHALVKLHLRPEVEMAQVKAIQVQPNLKAIVIYHRLIESPFSGSGFAGIDLGIVNLAAVAFQTGECLLYDGRAILDLDRQAGEQSLRLEKGSRRDQALWDRIRHIRRQALHHLTNSIIRECVNRQVGTLVVGNLTHIRQNKRQQVVRMWAFGRILEQLKYKALEQGIEVVQVDEHYTSQRCHWCGGPGRRSQRKRHFQCSICRRQIDADVGAAFNILNRRAPLSTYAWGIPPDSDQRYDLPLIEPTHQASFTQAFTLRLTPVVQVSLLGDPFSSIPGRLTRPPNSRPGKRGNRLSSETS